MAYTNKNEENYLCECGTEFLIVREANSAWIGEIKPNNACVVVSKINNTSSFRCPKCSREFRYYCPLSPINYDKPVTAKDMGRKVGFAARYFNFHKPSIINLPYGGKYIDIKGLFGRTHRFKRIDKITATQAGKHLPFYGLRNEWILQIHGENEYAISKVSTRMSYQEIKDIAGPIGFELPKPSFYFNDHLVIVGPTRFRGKDCLDQIKYTCKEHDSFYVNLLRDDQSLIVDYPMGYIETTKHRDLNNVLDFLGANITKTIELHFCNGVSLTLRIDKISAVNSVLNEDTQHTEVLYLSKNLGKRGDTQHRFIVREPAHHITRILKLAGNKNF